MVGEGEVGRGKAAAWAWEGAGAKEGAGLRQFERAK